ncbi:unconventional myosin-XV-like [Dama dama]|uniref:unconventional myosin-XV-like n=1 Tax=Dama dama TaxID=30532 RepID=UPI002A35FCC0|nr:unconventional myosin-XV-like [Dama dama]
MHPREGAWPREPDPRAPRPRKAPRLLKHLSRTLSGGLPSAPATEGPAVTGLAGDRSPARPAHVLRIPGIGYPAWTRPSRPGYPACAPPRPARIVSARHARPGLSLAELGGCSRGYFVAGVGPHPDCGGYSGS